LKEKGVGLKREKDLLTSQPVCLNFRGAHCPDALWYLQCRHSDKLIRDESLLYESDGRLKGLLSFPKVSGTLLQGHGSILSGYGFARNGFGR